MAKGEFMNCLPVATQAEAEAGIVNDKTMTPLRASQAIDALGVSQTALGSPSGTGMVGFVQSGVGAQLRAAEDKLREKQSVADRATMADALVLGLPVLLNAGSYLLVGAGENIGAGTSLCGDGVDATLVTVRPTAALTNLYGLTMLGNSAFSDTTVALDRNGYNWAAGIGFPQPASNIRIERTSFSSVGTVDGTFGLYVDGADVSDVTVRDATFDAIALPQVKGNQDISTQTRWRFENYRASGCIDGFNINSPKGEFSYGYVDSYIGNSTQFGAAFAGPKCKFWTGTIRAVDNDFEAVHIEDATHNFDFHVLGERNNRLPGVPGSPPSPEAANGAVSIIGGANAGLLKLNLDLSQNVGGSPVGVCIQHGGKRLSDQKTVVPFNIQMRGHIKGGAGRIGVLAIEATDRIVADHLSIESQPNDALNPALAIPGSNIGGEVYIKTPGVVIEANDNTPMTGLDTLVLSDVTSDFTDWVLGTTTDRTAIQVAQTIKLTRPFTIDSAASWQPVMPVFRDCRARAWWKFSDNGSANGAASFCDEFIVESGALVPKPVVVCAGGTTDPVPNHTPAVMSTGDMVNGSTIIANLSNTIGILPGHDIAGAGIPSGTKIVAVLSTTSIALDKAATASSTGVSLGIRTPPTSDLCWRVNAGMLECRMYNSNTANGTLSLVLLGQMTA